MDEDDEGGYDALFTEEVPDELKCVVCHMVLKDALQIMACGHRFCKTCFQRMEKHYEKTKMKFVCPIDREEISLENVFEDRGIRRSVGNLKVKCWTYDRGCKWVDDLRDLGEHTATCTYGETNSNIPSNSSEEDSINSSLLSELSKRLDVCENLYAQKYNDFHRVLDDLQESDNRRTTAMEKLKITDEDLRRDVKTVAEDAKRIDERLSCDIVEQEELIKRVERCRKDLKQLKNTLGGMEQKDNQMLKNLQRSLQESNQRLKKVGDTDKKRRSLVERRLDTVVKELMEKISGVEESANKKMRSCNNIMDLLGSKMIDMESRDLEVKNLKTCVDVLQEATKSSKESQADLNERLTQLKRFGSQASNHLNDLEAIVNIIVAPSDFSVVV